jgi:hypothetical protein
VLLCCKVMAVWCWWVVWRGVGIFIGSSTDGGGGGIFIDS